ncbi:hypothetical protein [Parapedobacter koreensis]|uniref:Outer membrane protein beta-barrel domain-containing protein n=1 Tax=Parapedobacter koreensis TaxID=332977 RepID=A0A1H7THN2_9SPHI|nr:hypothetical protein [Parapedobacter koreensis]SEL83327.1 hypothetical protein SAMN05421740_11125 [Parapedobacter koreensis]
MIGRCLILLLISYESLAQTYVGPNYQAMGFTGTALKGIYSLTANPAGLVGLERLTASVNYQHHFFTTDITTRAALLGIPTRLGVFGLAANRYGLKAAYDDTKVGFSFAKRFGSQFSIGLSTNYHQLFIPNYLSTFSLSVDLGVQYYFEQGATIGLQYTNLNKATYGMDVYGTIPSFIRFGASYPWAGVMVTADAVYRLEGTVAGNFGIAYHVGDILSLRGGLSTNPLQQHAGFGVNWQRFTMDAAATFHPRLGTSPQIGLSYAF